MYDASEDNRLKARNLFWQGYSPAEIARQLGVPYGTVDAWKRRDKWDDAPTVVRIEAHVETRLMQLIAKDIKSPGDFTEMDQLTRILERTARIERYGQTGKEADLNPNIGEREKKRADKLKKRKEEKNLLTQGCSTLIRSPCMQGCDRG